MKSLLFVTDGLIPLESFTTFGVNAKPNTTSPLGYFGTGLKMAIAILVRNGIKVQLFRGDQEYEFYTSEKDFRGKSFSHVRMKKRKNFMSPWTYEALPFTTELAKNWTLWEAYRELESNTRDEHGKTLMLPATEEGITPYSNNGNTVIRVVSDDICEIHESQTVFLKKEGKKLVYEDDVLEIYDAPSEFLYFRDVRVHSFKASWQTQDRKSRYTYNIKADTDLTEDRTLKYWFLTDSRIVTAFTQRVTDEDVLETVMKVASGSIYVESSFSWDDHKYSPNASEAFKRIARKYSVVGSRTYYDPGYGAEPDPKAFGFFNKDDAVLIVGCLKTISLNLDKISDLVEADMFDADPLAETVNDCTNDTSMIDSIVERFQAEIDDKFC